MCFYLELASASGAGVRGITSTVWRSWWTAVEIGSVEIFFPHNKLASLLGQTAAAVFSSCSCHRGDGGELEEL
jgi:hypothetical protein